MYELKNYMEVLVEQQFDMVTKDMDICKCEKCRLDIIAIALNSLTPRYIVTSKGNIYVRLNMLQQQFYTDIVAAITAATVVVGKNKRHDEE